jgi:hypothetical protein
MPWQGLNLHGLGDISRVSSCKSLQSVRHKGCSSPATRKKLKNDRTPNYSTRPPRAPLLDSPLFRTPETGKQSSKDGGHVKDVCVVSSRLSAEEKSFRSLPQPSYRLTTRDNSTASLVHSMRVLKKTATRIHPSYSSHIEVLSWIVEVPNWPNIILSQSKRGSEQESVTCPA